MLLLSFALLAIGARCADLNNETMPGGIPIVTMKLIPGNPAKFQNDVYFGHGYKEIRFELRAPDPRHLIGVECQVFLPCVLNAGLKVFDKEGRLELMNCTSLEGLTVTDQYVEYDHMVIAPFSHHTQSPQFQCRAEIISDPRPVLTTFRPLMRGVKLTTTCPCGRVSNQRIVKGEEARLGEIPWQVSYQFGSIPGHTTSTCGGTLLSEEMVLTAAHCLSDIRQSSILFATTDLLQGGFLVAIRSAVGHPYYDSRLLTNDIALVQLSKSVRFTRVTYPACLPRSMQGETFAGNLLQASGWGKTIVNGRPSRYLLKTHVKAISERDCKQIFGSQRITPGMLCTENTGGSGTCQGDSGGPLTYLHNNGLHYVVGVVSWGVDCAHPTYPSVFARVTEYMKWIDYVTGGSICSND